MYFSLPNGNEIERRTYFLTKKPKQTNKQISQKLCRLKVVFIKELFNDNVLP